MPGIDDLALELRDAAAHAARIATCCAAEKLTTRPRSDRWSPAECVEHLNLTTRAYLPGLDAASRELQEKGLRGNGPFKSEMMARVLHWMLEPPARMRMPTTPPFHPVIAADVARVFTDFQELQQTLLELLEGCRGYAIDQVQVVSPFSAHLRYNVHAAFSLIAVHQRRHLWQADHALAAPIK